MAGDVPAAVSRPDDDPTGRWRRHPRSLWRQALGEVTVLTPVTGEPLVLPAPGATVWLLLAEPLTWDQLVADVAEIYEVALEVVASDLAPFVRHLARLGVLIAP